MNGRGAVRLIIVLSGLVISVTRSKNSRQFWASKPVEFLEDENMKPLAFVVAIVVAACASGCVGSVSEPDGPVRIMCLGDSITAGYTDNPDWNVPFEFGYRGGLYSLLAAAGHDIQFVGESPEPWDGRFGLPTNTPKLDLRGMGQDKHRGYGGASIEDLSQEVEGYIESDKPDVILLMIGINGVDANSSTQLESAISVMTSFRPMRLTGTP